MKRFLSLILVLAMALVLSSCVKNNNTDATAPQFPSSSVQADASDESETADSSEKTPEDAAKDAQEEQKPLSEVQGGGERPYYGGLVTEAAEKASIGKEKKDGSHEMLHTLGERIAASLPEAVQPEIPIRVAVIDSGISTKAIPPERVAKGHNYVTNSDDTQDTYNHGTSTASVILQFAPYAKLVPLVCTRYQDGRVTQVNSKKVAQMVRDAVNTYACDVILVNAGIIKPDEELKLAVEEAEQEGVLVIAPVGNENESIPDKVYYPAGYETVLGVGALNEDADNAMAYSQRGEAVYLLAPGLMPSVFMSGTETYEAGTSTSAACTAGAVARILEKSPSLTPQQLRDLLKETAVDVNGEGYDTATGWGALNAASALEKLS